MKILFCLFLFINICAAQSTLRQVISLDTGWRTVAGDKQQENLNFEQTAFVEKSWKSVDVPHNWDDYDGYRRLTHGNRHGYAWYRKTFAVRPQPAGKRYFLFFEGVGSYATVWLNGQPVGTHAGGRTTFTLDVTNAIKLDKQPNLLAVRADHPALITDLPWVCGGCSDDRGFSEGSQPMGIFRPVHLLITDPVRIQPFGVHVWNDSTTTAAKAPLYLETEIKNYGAQVRSVTLVSRLVDKRGKPVFEQTNNTTIQPGQLVLIRQEPPVVVNPRLWSVENPYLYTLVSEVIENGKSIDRHITPYGIRWINWQLGKVPGENRFLLNGKPVFINGIAEYEHLLGKSHAFSSEQIRSRVQQIKAAGFNAFRDAHQPHNLRYQTAWDSLGILWWTQLSAHVWYDTPAFRQNFKTLLTEWVRERRNNPSVVLWGLQNESKLPADFARECTQLIRQLDPTASSQRKVTTCNGGAGTDWDVPQNWTGTYGGDPATYADDVKRQVLIGEYGAWRTADLHTEGPFRANGVLSEDRMTQLMETKIRLAESVRDHTAGQFFWLFTSHDNPGRVQGGEGLRELDRIGPVNYKGLLTPWEEPLDAYYMFRANYADKHNEPMVYIVSHTWPDRWIAPGLKDSLTVYSNCDEVDLFNDVRTLSLGKRTRQGIGTHFQWDNVPIQYNVLYAVGYVNGREVARDYIVLNHLPRAPHFDQFLAGSKPITASRPAYNYVYRVNCGGPDYTDKQGNTWMADRPRSTTATWGSTSWTNDFPSLPAFFASQRRTHDPIRGTTDWPLFQTFRYGREKLRYAFPVPDGTYRVELYFTEPWLGTGGGLDCTGWRLFDVAVNGKTVLKDLDIWKEAGHDGALKKVVDAQVTGGQLVISFPHVAAGQAVISGIAIATANQHTKPAPGPNPLITRLEVANSTANWSVQTWLDTGDKPYADDPTAFRSLPATLYGAEWLRGPKSAANVPSFTVSEQADVFVGLHSSAGARPAWLARFEDTKTGIENGQGETFRVYRNRYDKGATVRLGDPGSVESGTVSPFTVMVTPVSTIEPAYDLKPATTYTITASRLSGPGIETDSLNDRPVATIKKPAGGTLDWTLTTGVADTYSLTIRYANPTTRPLKARVELLLADGTRITEETLEFAPSRPGKWNLLTTSTGTMINAGTYTLRLTALDARQLSLYQLIVQ
ncbi:malectin domain-containing carbohydrate-binding protein [Fibrella arboris]|uniref:malectin domain-containing carbohydrate-binding protein n=1 Tax=Fibrella arboris TaxID=3242486 RepID=UPI0035226E12